MLQVTLGKDTVSIKEGQVPAVSPHQCHHANVTAPVSPSASWGRGIISTRLSLGLVWKC